MEKIKLLYIDLFCGAGGAGTAIDSAVKILSKFGVNPYKIFCYVLVKDVQDALFRIEYLRKLGVTPFAQPYMDFINNILPTQEQRDLARWCNHKAILKSCDFKDYQPRKGFYCREYFK
jgi:hypothetical protein